MYELKGTGVKQLCGPQCKKKNDEIVATTY